MTALCASRMLPSRFLLPYFLLYLLRPLEINMDANLISRTNHWLSLIALALLLANRSHIRITGSAVALHCVKAHRQSQWRSPNFNPL